MRSNRSLRSFAIGLLTGSLVASGGAAEVKGSEGLRVELELFEDGGDAPSHRATVFASERRIRIEQYAPGGEPAAPTFIYRGDLDRLYSVTEKEKSYVEIEPMLLSLLAGQTRVSRREVSGSLEGLPQDQQRAVGHLLGVATIDPKRPGDPLVVTATGEVDRVVGLDCRRVTLSRSSRLLAKGCVADWQTVGLTPADVEVFRSLASFVREAAGSRLPIPVELIPGQPLDLVVQLGGFPVAFERAGKAAGASAIRVAAVESIPLADAQFEVPEGYAARSGISGIASLAGLLSIQSGPPNSGVPTASDPEADPVSGAASEAVLPAAMDPAAMDPAEPGAASPSRASEAPRGRPDYQPIRLFDDSE